MRRGCTSGMSATACSKTSTSAVGGFVNAGIFRRARCGGLRPAALRGLAFVIATFWHDLAEADPTPYTGDMPIDRDDHDERLARIEQMLEDSAAKSGGSANFTSRRSR